MASFGLASRFKVGAELAETTTNLVYHSTTRPGVADDILRNGIDPNFFNSASRFGKGFYVGNSPSTTIAELGYHGYSRVNTIRYTLENAKLFNATGRIRIWDIGVKYTPRLLGKGARLFNYDGIIFNSLRSSGTNTVLFKNFGTLRNGTKIF
ncbi:MAG: hypothetical protein RIG77_04725 [Cyclobacteriaceae bacterium]